MKIRIERTEENDKQTLGKLVIIDDWGCEIFNCYTLELPDKNNQRNVSRIPKGTYNSKRRFSNKYGEHCHLLKVPSRSYILIHAGNYFTQIRGCILVGDTNNWDINGDGEKDVSNSKNTLKELMDILPDKFEVEIY